MTAPVVGQDTAAPPASGGRSGMVDLLAHLRGLLRELPAALVAAAGAGLAVFLVLSAQVPLYAATVSAWVDTGSPPGSPADVTTRAAWTASAVSLAQDPDVLQDIVAASGQEWTREQTTRRITAAEDPTPGVMSVRVLGPSPDAAVEVADQSVETLDDELRRAQRTAVAEQLGDLQRQATAVQARLSRLPSGDPASVGLQAELTALLDQVSQVRTDEPVATLTPLAPASSTEDPVSPRPLASALTAAVATLVVVTEGLALVRRSLRARRARHEARRTLPA